MIRVWHSILSGSHVFALLYSLRVIGGFEFRPVQVAKMHILRF